MCVVLHQDEIMFVEFQAPEWLQETETKMLSGDAFLFLACEYNRNVGPALCNFIDYFGQNVFVSKPCGIVSYSMGKNFILEN